MSNLLKREHKKFELIHQSFNAFNTKIIQSPNKKDIKKNLP